MKIYRILAECFDKTTNTLVFKANLTTTSIATAKKVKRFLEGFPKGSGGNYRFKATVTQDSSGSELISKILDCLSLEEFYSLKDFFLTGI